MTNDVFGDLRQWDNVLAELGRQAADGTLDECQDGMARILRYGLLFRLNEVVLARATEIKRPSGVLAAEILRILTTKESPFDQRLLAAKALGTFLSCPAPREDSGVAFDMERVREVMEDVQKHAGAPVLVAALENALR